MKTKNWKIWTGVVAALIAMMNMVPMVSAADVTVTVTVQWLSVTLNATTLGFGLVKTSSSTVTGPILATNDGNWPINLTLKQTYSNNASNNWTIGTTISDVGTDKYILAAKLQNITPTSGDFNNTDVLTTSVNTAANGVFGSDAGNIDANGWRRLWLLFKAPTTNSNKAQGIITVTVGAVAA